MFEQITLFDLFFEKSNFKPEEKLALCGTGFEGGMQRVKDFFKECSNSKQKAAFLKKEYGIGGFSRLIKKPCCIRSAFTQGEFIEYKYYDENTVLHEEKISFEKMAKVITKMICEGKYKKE